MTPFFLFVLIKYAKMSYFDLLDYIGVVGIQGEKPRCNPHENTEVSQKGL